MATASTSGQSPFGLGRRKRHPGILDQIGRFFGGDKRRKGKGSFRAHLSASPQRPLHSSARRRGHDNAVVHFFKSIVSPPRPKSRWRGLSAKLGWGDRRSSPARFYEVAKSPLKGRRGADGQGTFSKLFKLGGRRSRSPSKR
ncbi:myelin basic protein-like isoform X1 [Paramormyrops kingsleyae]|uniref:Myelin basic protein n=2 Tax=Paramormyrops kingsleyae TaxID=1676925 RepID=A0A3B3TGN8_9TELE|nr:myelin basic protein-like isoform X1 [Paramormyrops kingsleyae]